MKSKLIVASLLVALLGGVVAPPFAGRAAAAAPTARHVAGGPQTRAAFLDKTKFLFHAGIAFFIIHHEYHRYKQGYFNAGTPGRVRHLAVAALALVIAVHEAKVAYGIAEKSNSKTLHVLASPFAALAATIDGIRGKFARGQGSPTDLAKLNSTAGAINSTAGSNGTGSIKDVSWPLPKGA